MKADAETRWVWIKFLFVGRRFSSVQVIYIYIYTFYFSGHVTRSSPVLYHEYCIQDGNLLPRLFSLLLLTPLLPAFTTHALLPIFLEKPWVLQWIRIRVDGKIRFQNGYACTWKFLNPEINSCRFIILGYVWRGPEWTIGWFATQWAVAK